MEDENYVGTFVKLLSGMSDDIEKLKEEVDQLKNDLVNKADKKHTHSVSLPYHNHGNPQNMSSGGTLTTAEADN